MRNIRIAIPAIEKLEEKKKKKMKKHGKKKGVSNKMENLRMEEEIKSIQSVRLEVTFDNINIPAFKAVVILVNRSETTASVPSAEIPLEDMLGGIMNVAHYFNEKIAPSLVGKDVTEQYAIDKDMTMMVHQQAFDKTKLKLFRNAIFAVSLAVCKAGAIVKNLLLFSHIADLAGNKDLSFPVPVYNVMKPIKNPDYERATQECILLPLVAPSIRNALYMTLQSFKSLRNLYPSKFGLDASEGKSNEGLLLTDIKDLIEGVEILVSALDNVGLTGKVIIGVEDVIRCDLLGLKHKLSLLSSKEENNENDEDAFKEVMKSFVSEYPITRILYPFGIKCSRLYSKLNKEGGLEAESLKAVMKRRTCLSLLLKMNQIGSVTECIEAVKITKRAGWSSIMSNYCSSGETDDTSVADLAVGLGVDQIRLGALNNCERADICCQFVMMGIVLGNVDYAGPKFLAM